MTEASAGPDEAPEGFSADPSVSVVIPAYSMKRWPQTRKAVESARHQTAYVDEVILCIDNNQELLELAANEWPGVEGTPVRVLANRYDAHLSGRDEHVKVHGESRRFGAGSARNTAAETVESEIVAFMDDDAWAEPDWIQRLLSVYRNPSVMAVGGAPIPDYETSRPVWYPPNFDWVFGCVYDGLPRSEAPTRRLIGANMSVRREALEAIGGFHVDEFDDLDLCMRVAARYGEGRIIYNPHAVVHHYVPRARVTWRYFWRRCFFVNRAKIRAFRGMGSAASLSAEREFVWMMLKKRSVVELRRAVRREPGAIRTLLAMTAGVALAAAGHVRGRLDQLTR